MMYKFHLTCTYCGHYWNVSVLIRFVEEPICPICTDKHIKVEQEQGKGDVFGYERTDTAEDAYIRKK